MQQKVRVGVVRGGPSNEYEVSLRTGASVIQTLLNSLSHRFRVIDIFIDQSGIWHANGRAINPTELSTHVDVVWNGLHGAFGEDGTIQAFFESLAIPYTGSDSAVSALGMNKKQSKDIARRAGLRVPADIVLTDYRSQDIEPLTYFNACASRVFNRFAAPWVVKPLAGGSSIGVSIARTREQLIEALIHASEQPGDIMVEEYIRGREATVATVDAFRGQSVYSFLPIEIRVPQGKFFDYAIKYSVGDHEISPGKFSSSERTALEEASRTMHRALGVRHYARTDLMLTPRGVYFIEINTLPGLTEHSLVPKALTAVGATLPHFVEHVLDLALKPKAQ